MNGQPIRRKALDADQSGPGSAGAGNSNFGSVKVALIFCAGTIEV
jgi:hypothetical protein